jgi:hypothetical protein
MRVNIAVGQNDLYRTNETDIRFVFIFSNRNFTHLLNRPHSPSGANRRRSQVIIFFRCVFSSHDTYIICINDLQLFVIVRIRLNGNFITELRTATTLNDVKALAYFTFLVLNFRVELVMYEELFLNKLLFD